MTELDHITVIAPDLAAGAAWVREAIGVEPAHGGAHAEMGTHNRLLRLGDGVFLEIIAVDPEGRQPRHRRWFGLDDREARARDWRAGCRLRSYVARCRGLEDAIGDRITTFGAPMHISRGDRRWRFAVRPDDRLPGDGALPNLIDWGERGTAAKDMAESGLRLSALVIETPEPDTIRKTLDAIGMARPPEVRQGASVRLFAVIDTPAGARLLS